MVEQQLLFKQILTRIACNTKLGEDNNLYSAIFGLSYNTLNLLYIVLNIGHLDRWYCSRYVYKSVFHSFTF